MRELTIVTGMVLEATPVNDYDRRVVILTTDRGKITTFCRGARRQNNKMMAVTNPFAFGNFKVTEGKNAYNLYDADISYYFEELRDDFEGAYLGMYFLEYASYYSREYSDDRELLKLLFQSIRAIVKNTIDRKLIKAVFEVKILVVNGEFPGIPVQYDINASTHKAVDFIVKEPVKTLYTFAVNDSVLKDLIFLGDYYRDRYADRNFKSLEILKGFM